MPAIVISAPISSNHAAPVSAGGTGATTAAAARTNLDVYSKSEVTNAISQSTANAVAKAGYISLGQTTWAGLLAALRAGLNQQNRSIALFACYDGAAAGILTNDNYRGYLKGYVTMSGANQNLYDFFAGPLSVDDMYAWRVTATDEAPTISGFKKFVADVEWYKSGDTISNGQDWITVPGICKDSSKTLQFTLPLTKRAGTDRTYTLSTFNGQILKPGGGMYEPTTNYLTRAGCTTSIIANGNRGLIVNLAFDSALSITSSSFVGFFGAFYVTVT